MTTILDSTLELRCVRYRSEFRLPASIDPTSRRILLDIGIHYGAITMPAPLGERVRQRLASTGITTPVLDHPRAKSWTFLTGPTPPGYFDVAVSAELFRLYATVACAGSHIVLPSPDDERTGYRTWVRLPDDTAALPPLTVLIEATRAVGTREYHAL